MVIEVAPHFVKECGRALLVVPEDEDANLIRLSKQREYSVPDRFLPPAYASVKSFLRRTGVPAAQWICPLFCVKSILRVKPACLVPMACASTMSSR
jgi:hypothetical protein